VRGRLREDEPVKIALMSYGTTGDVRPMVALALGLRASGHDVTLVSDADGLALAASNGLDYRPLAGRLRDLIKPGGAAASTMEAGRLTVRSARDYTVPDRAWLETMADAAAGADVVLGMPLAGFHAGSAALAAGAKRIFAVLQPLEPTRDFPPIVLGLLTAPRWLNRPLGRLVQSSGWLVAGRSLNRARRDLGQPRISDPIQGQPMLCAWSPTLLAAPTDWPAGRFTVTGAWHLPPDPAWRPDAELQSFLDAGEPPIYVGFGSMPTISGMDRLLDVLLKGLAGRRILLSAGWAELGRESLGRGVHRIGPTPHDWLFPRCAAIVHHCGAGTTHAAAASGVPSIPVPFTLDQPFWADRLHAVGIGSRPLDPRRPQPDTVAAALAEVGSASMRERTRAVAAAMASEDGVAVAVRTIEALAGQA
jgi:UDP:flavonoid glycosyltransferase YjiC (YdhE family)